MSVYDELVAAGVPTGKVALSTRDPLAADLLLEFACRYRTVDREFADDLRSAVERHGFRFRFDRDPQARNAIVRALEIARGIAACTICPDPVEGGCIGGPVPGHGCVNEAARSIATLLTRALGIADPR